MSGRDLLTAAEAATLAGVAVETIHTWRKRAVLKPYLRHPDGSLRYRPSDVLEAERQTRNADPTRRRARRLAQEATREP